MGLFFFGLDGLGLDDGSGAGGGARAAASRSFSPRRWGKLLMEMSYSLSRASWVRASISSSSSPESFS